MSVIPRLSRRLFCCQDLKLQLRAECPLWQKHKPGVWDGSAGCGVLEDRLVTEEGRCKGFLFEKPEQEKKKGKG